MMAESSRPLPGFLQAYQAHMERRSIIIADLHEQCSNEEVIAKIASKLDIWEITATHLGLTKHHITTIKRDNKEDLQRRVATLNKWIEKKGDGATYFNLVKACHELENTEMIDFILDRLKEEKEKNDEGLDSDSSDQLKEEDMRFLCGCGKCSLDDFLRNGCPRPWENSVFPLLKIKHLPRQKKLVLLARLQNDAANVKNQFGSLSRKVLRSLRNQYGNTTETANDLVVYILPQQLFSYMEEEKQIQFKSDLRKATTVADVMMLLTDNYISWFNHPLLGSITEEFQVATQEYHDYVEKNLKQFLQRSLFEIPSGSFSSSSPTKSGQFVLKIDIPPPRSNLKGSLLLPLTAHVASTLGIAIDALEICSYDKGCVQLTIGAPSSLLKSMFPLPSTVLLALRNTLGDCSDLTIKSIIYADNCQSLPQKTEDSTNCSVIEHTSLTIVNKNFASLILEAIRCIKSNAVKLVMVKQFLIELSSQKLTMNSKEQPFLHQVRDEIEGASTVQDLIFILNDYWSFFNYKLLGCLLNRFGNHSARERLRKYLQPLKMLKASKLPVLLHPTKEVKGFSPDVVQVTTTPNVLQHTTADDIMHIQETLANILHLEAYTLLLRQIHKDSCQLDFLIVQSYEDVLRIDDLGLRSLHEAGVVRIDYKNDHKHTFQDSDDMSEIDSGVATTEEVSDCESTTEKDRYNIQQGILPEDRPVLARAISLSRKEEFEFEKHPMRLSLDERSTNIPPGFSFTQSPTHLSLPERFPGAYVPNMNQFPLHTMNILPYGSGRVSVPFSEISLPGFSPGFVPMIPQEYPYSGFVDPITHLLTQEKQPNMLFMENPNESKGTKCIFPTDSNVNEEEEWPDLSTVKPKPRTFSKEKTSTKKKNRNGVLNVCMACFLAGHNREELIDAFCLLPFQHQGISSVSVAWDEPRQCLVGIRPRPLILLKGSFKLCTPATCRGKGCTYPHSQVERDAWNYDKQMTKKGPTEAFNSTVVTKNETKGKPDTSCLSAFQSSTEKISKQQPKNDNQVTKKGPNIVTDMIVKDESLKQSIFTTSPHTSTKIMSQSQIKSDNKPEPQYKEREAWKTSFHRRLENTALHEENLKPDLSTHNYRDKFYNLLCYEESKHITLLTDRCDGEYNFTFLNYEKQAGLQVCIGCIEGMTGDQIQYAAQASEGVYFVDTDNHEDLCKAEISTDNYYNVNSKFLVVLTEQDVEKLKRRLKKVTNSVYRVEVEFEVKHSYFNTLHRAVISVPQSVIARIVPSREDIIHDDPEPIRKVNHKCLYSRMCVDEFGQLEALEAILQRPANVPVVVSGPFGSGKTRVIARAAYEFVQEGLQHNRSTRILICAHHSNTVDGYVRSYLGPVFEGQQGVKIIKIARKAATDYSQSNIINRNIYDFRRDITFGRYIKDCCVVVITTFMSSMQVADIFSSRKFSFTHILLDEVAQIREPEAIVSLCVANTVTKIVIAGDSKQVGPSVVVLGHEARKYGLQKSLLERLEEKYKEFGYPASKYLKQLGLNYRCHPTLTSLLSNIMYDHPIQPGRVPKNEHPGSKGSPCVFYCSDVNDSSINTAQFEDSMLCETDAVISQLKFYFEQWPRRWKNTTLRDVCIISSNRSQLNQIKRKLRAPLNQVTLLPSYVIQGHEFQAVIISTLELIDEDGLSCNPTKSLLTPRIFNTTLSRSKSLVVAVGNPFSLLRAEEKMGHPERCWKEYLKLCLKKDTVFFPEEVHHADMYKDRLAARVGVYLEKPNTSPWPPLKSQSSGSSSSVLPTKSLPQRSHSLQPSTSSSALNRPSPQTQPPQSLATFKSYRPMPKKQHNKPTPNRPVSLGVSASSLLTAPVQSKSHRGFESSKHIPSKHNHTPQTKTEIDSPIFYQFDFPPLPSLPQTKTMPSSIPKELVHTHDSRSLSSSSTTMNEKKKKRGRK